MSDPNTRQFGDSVGPQEVFYAYPDGKRSVSFSTPPQNLGFDKGKEVALEYLSIDGSLIADSYYFQNGKGGSSSNNYYKRLKSDGSIDEQSQFQNSHNFLVVPQNFDLSQVMLTAKAVGDLYKQHHELQADAMLVLAFKEGGTLDYQRGKLYGVPPGEIDVEAVDSASFMFGFTTELGGIPEQEAEKGAGRYNTIVNRHTATGPFGMNPRDYEEFSAGYDFARHAADDPNSSIYKMMKAFGLGVSNQPGNAKSFAPGASLVSPAPTKGKKHTYNDHRLPATFGGFFHMESSEPAFASALADGLNWMHQFEGAAGSIQLGHASLFSPFKERQTGETAFMALATHWFFGGARLPGSRSFAPVSANLAHASRGSLWEPAEIASDGSGIQTIADRLSWRVSGDLLATSTDTHRGRRRSSAGEGSDAGFPDPEHRVRLSERGLSQSLNEYFMRQARLPPAGGSGFDPRLTPAWPGVKVSG